MLNKILMAALVALALAVLGVGAWGVQANSRADKATKKADQYQRSYEDEKRSREAGEKSRDALAAAAKVRAARLVATNQALEAKNKELSDALKANPGWASSPVPDSVWDAVTQDAPDAVGTAR